MFKVIQMSANWDSEKRKTVAVFSSRFAAEREIAAMMETRVYPWCAYIIVEE